ncbi:hypothetical protein CLOM_g2577 [Closterium sp. NIES-68]|nr:hypothetical protein CLOM_g2577 [Closterium sp. NIES-68]GJP77044.1 hypothetical protein CLOP_g7477 [Closterium sp. NIES-67]
METGTPKLTEDSDLLTYGDANPRSGSDIYSSYVEANGGELGPYGETMRRAGYQSFPAEVHRAVAIPTSDIDGQPACWYARAALRNQKEPAFSCVSISSTRGQPVYGQLLLLLRAERLVGSQAGQKRAVAYVRTWTTGAVDDITGCSILHRQGGGNGYTVVPIERLTDVVHVVKSFEHQGVWPLNRWAHLRRPLTGDMVIDHAP